jgi:glycosyltransferase involved in cell wall biosynthesis
VTGIARLRAERREIDRLAAESGADLFHVQFKREQIGLTDVLARHAPVVWTEHGRFLKGKRGAALAAGYRVAARKASAIVCVSDAVATDVRHIVGKRCRIEVIENAVDTKAMRPPTPEEKRAARRTFGFGDQDGPLLLWIGRLDASKLPGLALEVGDRWPGVTLIVGDGPERAALEQAPRRRDVRMAGYLAEPAIAYRAADVLLFTSTGVSEGYPTVLLEAAAYGVPLVTNEESGAGILVSAAGGEVRNADLQQLSDAAELVVREGRGVQARNWAELHDVEPWVARHAEVLDSVANS